MLYHVTIDHEIPCDEPSCAIFSHTYHFETSHDAHAAYISYTEIWTEQGFHTDQEFRVNDACWLWQGTRNDEEYTISLWYL